MKIIGVTNLVLEGVVVSSLNQGIFVENCRFVTLRNCEVHHVGQEAIHVLANSSHIIIEGCTIHHTRQWRYNGEGVYIGTGSAGVRDNTAFVTVRSNVIYQTTDEAIELKPGTRDCLIEGNRIFDVATGKTWGAIEINEHALGQQFWGANPNHVVCFNSLQDTDTAIRAGTGCVVSSNRIERVRSGNYGIYCNNNARDNYVRRITHNLVRMPLSGAIHVEGGIVEVQGNVVGQE